MMITRLKIAISESMMRKLWTMTRTHIERSVRPGTGGIALLGDSITHLGKWDLMFPRAPIRNFGIAGERSDHLLARTQPLVTLRPEKLFILIGTNDLSLGVPPAKVASHIDTLIDRLRRDLPLCEIHLQAVMPRARKFTPRILELNSLLAGISGQRGARFIDVFPSFVDATGQIKAEYTEDLLHLNGAGYEAWGELLRPFFAPAAVLGAT